jgi:hypothetical protein
MRLPNIPSNQVTAEQRPLFDRLNTGIRENLQGFTTQKPEAVWRTQSRCRHDRL